MSIDALDLLGRQLRNSCSRNNNDVEEPEDTYADDINWHISEHLNFHDLKILDKCILKSEEDSGAFLYFNKRIDLVGLQ